MAGNKGSLGLSLTGPLVRGPSLYLGKLLGPWKHSQGSEPLWESRYVTPEGLRKFPSMGISSL